ncbi:hypothetical protein POM88_012509 [Heracleum sosnowskyi]|uniref:Uncharacterized protein n=1 Tax=Heracleum sosnowskyi TaxID=360622 RepID=A0AAD8N3H8_9APIA|nr:hypothetical protein POM88_012509 [Heracleum sosnowskyi]
MDSNGDLDAKIEALLNSEKQMRLNGDVAGTKKAKLTFSLGNPGTSAPQVSNSATLSSLSVSSTVGGTSNSPNDILRAAPPALASFIAILPAVEGHDKQDKGNSG